MTDDTAYCRRCDSVLPLSAFGMYRKRDGREYRTTFCKACERRRVTEYRRKRGVVSRAEFLARSSPRNRVTPRVHVPLTTTMPPERLAAARVALDEPRPRTIRERLAAARARVMATQRQEREA